MNALLLQWFAAQIRNIHNSPLIAFQFQFKNQNTHPLHFQFATTSHTLLNKTNVEKQLTTVYIYRLKLKQ